MPKLWTPELDEKLILMCKNGTPNTEIAKAIDMPLEKVHQRRSQLGITRAKIAEMNMPHQLCDCCGKYVAKTTTMLMPDETECEFCKDCEAVNDFIESHIPKS